MATLQLGQYFQVGVKWTDNQGNPMEPFEGALPIWSVDRTNVIEYAPSQGTPGTAECRAIKLGDCTLTATAPFDTGFGIQNGSQSEPISVVEVVTPNGEIVISYGAILPMNTKP